VSTARGIVGAVLVAVCLAVAACGRGDHHHGWDWERMRQQPRADAYEGSSAFANGRVMQTPPAGTVPREQLTGEPLLAAGQEDGRFASSVPLSITPELLETGQSRFGIFCAVCHGAGGYGGSIVAMNMQPPRPPSLRSDTMRALPPGLVFQVVTNGFGRMPSYAAQLSVGERWAVVAYVRQLQQTTSAATPEARADSARAALLRTIVADSTGTTGAPNGVPRQPPVPGARTGAPDR
jgi:mono/diheme cytochrome c family protein